MPGNETFYEDLDRLIKDRYEPLADQARRTGQTMSADFLSHLVKIEVENDLHELSAAMAPPHPRYVSEILPIDVTEETDA